MEECEFKDFENRPLIPGGRNNNKTFVYKRRWWILAVFSLACASQAMVWNTWGPIAESLELVFGWSDGVVALLPTLGNISYLLFVIPVSLAMDSKGLRLSMIFCSSCLIVCTALRCVTLEENIFTPLAYVSGFIQGFTGIVPFSAPALVSAIWFPVEERPTVTAIGSFFNYFGVSFSFILGPQLVPAPIYSKENSSSLDDKSTNKTVVNLRDLKSGISRLMYVHTTIAIFLFILIVAYFPVKPPKPPSITAGIQRTNYKRALRAILTNGPLWVISVAASLPLGVAGAWIVIIDIIIKAIGVSQVDAGWMGFLHILVGCLFGIGVSKYSSFFHRRRKFYLSVLFMCAGVSSIWFSLISDSVLPFNLPSLYVACILIGIFINGTTPLFYEMAAEAAYPVGEGLSGGFYSCIHDIFSTAFLALVSIPDIEITWLNWTILGAICISIPMLLFFPEQYKRSDIDMKIDN